MGSCLRTSLFFYLTFRVFIYTGPDFSGFAPIDTHTHAHTHIHTQSHTHTHVRASAHTDNSASILIFFAETVLRIKSVPNVSKTSGVKCSHSKSRIFCLGYNMKIKVEFTNE